MPAGLVINFQIWNKTDISEFDNYASHFWAANIFVFHF